MAVLDFVGEILVMSLQTLAQFVGETCRPTCRIHWQVVFRNSILGESEENHCEESDETGMIQVFVYH